MNIDLQVDFFLTLISQSGTIFSPSVGERGFDNVEGLIAGGFLTPSPRPLPPCVLV